MYTHTGKQVSPLALGPCYVSRNIARRMKDTLNAAGLLECSHAYCVIVLYPLPVSRFPHSFEDSSSEVPRRELGGVGVEMDANFLQGRAGQVMVHRAR